MNKDQQLSKVVVEDLFKVLEKYEMDEDLLLSITSLLFVGVARQTHLTEEQVKLGINNIIENTYAIYREASQ